MFREELIAFHSILRIYGTDGIENTACSIVALCIHCRRNAFTEPLASNDTGDTKTLSCYHTNPFNFFKIREVH
jgi:hypothetical protein